MRDAAGLLGFAVFTIPIDQRLPIVVRKHLNLFFDRTTEFGTNRIGDVVPVTVLNDLLLITLSVIWRVDGSEPPGSANSLASQKGSNLGH